MIPELAPGIVYEVIMEREDVPPPDMFLHQEKYARHHKRNNYGNQWVPPRLILRFPVEQPDERVCS